MARAGDDSWLGRQNRVVEELDSGVEDGEYGALGVGPASSSSALALANRGGLRSRGNVGEAGGYNDSSEEDDSEVSGGDSEPDEREQEMVEAALARIRRAQTKGKKDVKLSKEELASLERRRKRMQNGTERVRKEQRVAVPLAQYFDMSASDMLPAHPSPADLASDSRQQEAYPPVGAAPTTASRGDKSSRRRPRADPSDPSPNQQRDRRGNSPFRFSYVQQPEPVIQRHVSDTTVIGRPPSSGPLPHEDGRMPHAAFLAASASAPSIPGAFMENTPNPFQFMTGGTPTQHAHRPPAAGERRYHSGPANEMGYTYGAGPLHDGRNRHAVPDYDDGEMSEGQSAEGSDIADDEPLPRTREPLAVVSSNGKRHSTSSNSSGAGVARRRGRSRESPIIVEDASPEPESERRSRHSQAPYSKKTSSAAGLSSSASATRGKPLTTVASSSGGGGGSGSGSGTRRRKK